VILRILVAITVICCFAPTLSYSYVKDSDEIFRIRVENSVEGRVQVSTDSGKTYATVGHVNHPATRTLLGFAASAYTPDRAVAATAVHSIRVKTYTTNGEPMTVSIVASEFLKVPSDYGGYIPYDSGIYTDIPAGQVIFRNFAPFVGNPAKLERGGSLIDIPQGWQPASGDVLVVIAYLPNPYLRELVFENKAKGQVTATYTDGKTEQVGTVIVPVIGVGRFDATSYTGEGFVNTNHGGVVTISTAPIANSTLHEGKGDERRGGFQIQPSVHWKTQIPMPQSMAVAPMPGARPLEGQPPIFAGYISLAYDAKSPDRSMRVECGFADGTWQAMPGITGKEDDIFRRLGVTKIRLLFPKYDEELLTNSLAIAATRPRGATIKGIARLAPSKEVRSGSMVAFMVDGRVQGITNRSPYYFLWDTTTARNGEHDVEIDVSDPSGVIISTDKKHVAVWNPG
jgi:hypothetical protein